MAATVLIIDDDQKLNDLVVQYLAKFEMTVLTATHPDKGLEIFRKKQPHIVILDVMLPSRTGIEICKEIRKESSVPIIMLSARGESTDKVVGLEMGADDYLAKPFEPRELVARINTILRRTTMEQTIKSEVVTCQDLVVDFRSRSITLGGVPVELTTMEFEILSLFVRDPGAALNRDQIMDKIRGIDWEAFNRSIDVTISRLRQKLKDNPKKPRFFKTIWGTGYMFIGKVTPDEL